jgi:predicted NUDIX family NTP pyrophosphohydrolase
MPVRSAGLILYKVGQEADLHVWIGHMGGPFWARKDSQAWSIPKGEYDETEDALAAARREFEEEIGVPAPDVPYVHLGDFRQPSGKVVSAFAGEADLRLDRIVSNTFALEWPKGSGTVQDFPEIDDARWVTVDDARGKLVKGQLPILSALENLVSQRGR